MSWDSRTEENIAWFEEVLPNLPTSPYRLYPHIELRDPAWYYDMLQADIATGPERNRARYGALQKDLERLRELFGGVEIPRRF